MEDRVAKILAQRAALGAGEFGRGEARLGDQEAAGGLLVEPMHQPRFLALGVAHHLQHLVDMPRGAGTALHREPGRLVQHEHVIVLVKRHGLQRGKRLFLRFRERVGDLWRI